MTSETRFDDLDWISSVAWSPNGDGIAVAVTDAIVRLWSVHDQQIKLRLKLPPENRSAFSASDEWDDGFDHRDFRCYIKLSWCPSGSHLLIAGVDAYMFRERVGKLIRVTKSSHTSIGQTRDEDFFLQPSSTPNPSFTPNDSCSLAWSPGARVFAIGRANGSISIFDSESSKATASLEGHSASVDAVSFLI
jgi:WD40 repeat protein